MNWRKRKKVSECSHYYYDSFMVTDDPYPIYDSEEYCKIRWRELQEKNERPDYCEICNKCKHFTASRPNIRKERERKRRIKEEIRYWDKRARQAFRDGTYAKEFCSDSDRLLPLDLPF